VLLAAGGSKRLGTPKQLITYRNRLLINHALCNLQKAGMPPPVVVLGGYHNRILPEIAESHGEIIINESWEKGIGTSIKLAVTTVQKKGHSVAGWCFCLVDQPFIPVQHLSEMQRVFYRHSALKIVATEFTSAVGVPAIIPRSFTPEILNLPDFAGCKSIIKGHGPKMIPVPCPAAAVDIDIPSDLIQLQLQIPDVADVGRA
jgi:molybdenum cofactor cytidylyltransferase